MRIHRILFLAILSIAFAASLAPAARAQSQWRSQFDEDGVSYDLEVTGEVRFSDDDSGVASLEPGGVFRLTYRDGRGTRSLVVESGGSGALSYDYRVDGRRADYDERARADLAPVFLLVIRQTGVGVEARVARILRTKGVDGVLTEIGFIGSTRGSLRYFLELVEQAELTAEQRLRLVQMAPDRMSSSRDRSRFFIAAAPKYMGDDRSATAFLEAAGTVPSSGDLTRVLLAASPELVNRGAVSRAYFGAVNRISSSGDRSRVLLSLLESEKLDEATLLEAIDASVGLSSSGDKSRVLLAAAPHIHSDRLVGAYVRVAESISSSGDRSRALAAVIGAN